MKPLSISERLRLFPVRRALAAALACIVTPTCLVLAIESGDSSFVAVSLGLGCLSTVSGLRPTLLFPFWRHGFDPKAIGVLQQKEREAKIGSDTALNLLQTLGMILSAIGSILNLGHYL